MKFFRKYILSSIIVILITQLSIILVNYIIAGYKQDKRLTRSASQPFRKSHSRMGKINIRNAKFRIGARVGEKSIFNHWVQLDEYGRRQTPFQSPVKNKKHIIFFGCSMTFGIGVSDDETIPYYFGELSQSYRPYNYGVGSWGTSNVLALIKSKNFENEIVEKNGLALYLFYTFHIERSIISLSTASWAGKAPYYEFNEKLNQYEFRGLFKNINTWPMPLYRWLHFSLFTQAFNFRFLEEYSKSHLKFTAKMLKRIQVLYNDKHPNSQLLIVLVDRPSEILLNYIQEEKISYLGPIEVEMDENYHYPHDGHYTKIGTKYKAKQIWDKISNFQTSSVQHNAVVKSK